jgi:hypothetical protein
MKFLIYLLVSFWCFLLLLFFMNAVAAALAVIVALILTLLIDWVLHRRKSRKNDSTASDGLEHHGGSDYQYTLDFTSPHQESAVGTSWFTEMFGGLEGTFGGGDFGGSGAGGDWGGADGGSADGGDGGGGGD